MADKTMYGLKELEGKADAFVRHQTYLARYGASIAKEILLLFDDKELISLIQSNKSKAAVDRKITKIINGYRQQVAKSLEKAWRELTAIELDWLKSLLKIALKSAEPITKVIRTAADYPLVYTVTTPANLIQSAFDRFQTQSTNAAMMHKAELLPVQEIIDAYKAAYIQMKYNMDMSVRTMAFAVASQARESAYKANPSLIRGVIITAVLDGRTTNFCKMMDGTIFALDEGPRPPYHPRCRTIALPVFTGETDEQARKKLEYRARVGPGEDYVVGDNDAKSTKKNIARGIVEVASPAKPQKESSTYAHFLKSQIHTDVGMEFIRDTLGVTRGNWFISMARKGGNIEKILKNAVELELKSITAKELKSRKYK
jgi:SPP1 gp7 family putative phage head morphogenesis protein